MHYQKQEIHALPKTGDSGHLPLSPPVRRANITNTQSRSEYCGRLQHEHEVNDKEIIGVVNSIITDGMLPEVLHFHFSKLIFDRTDLV